MIRRIRRVGWTATLVVLASCASYKPVSAPVPVPANLQWSEPVGGYKAGAEALTQAHEQERYFDGDLGRAGVIPIQVVIRNTDGAPALVRRSDMALVLPDGRAIAPSSAQMAASEVGEDGSVVGATLMFGIFGLLAAASAEDDARAARTSDYRYIQLKDTTLGAGRSAQGIVFFIVPVGTPDFRGPIDRHRLRRTPPSGPGRPWRCRSPVGAGILTGMPGPTRAILSATGSANPDHDAIAIVGRDSGFAVRRCRITFLCAGFRTHPIVLGFRCGRSMVPLESEGGLRIQ
jgi:hypothetical protein